MRTQPFHWVNFRTAPPTPPQFSLFEKPIRKTLRQKFHVEACESFRLKKEQSVVLFHRFMEVYIKNRGREEYPKVQ
jgi:hypothetical protein